MNHGSFDQASLVNNLLGAVGNHPAGAKKTASNSSTDSAQRFQDAMQKARPEVAAREPVVAKRPDPVKRAEPAKPDARERAADKLQQRGRDSVTQTQQDVRIKSQRADANVVAKRADETDKPVQSATDIVDDASNSNSTCVADNAEAKIVAPADADAKQQNPAQTGEAVVENTETVIDNPLLNLLVIAPTPMDDTNTTIVLMAPTGELSDSEPLNILTTDLVLDIDAALLATSVPAETTGVDEAMLAAGALAATLAQGVGGVLNAKVASGSATPSGGFDVGARLSVDAGMTDLSMTESLDIAVENDAEGDVSDPLLGTKTAFSKLMDLSLLNAGGAGDKTAPALEGAKLAPALTTGNPALDVLTRLSEAQTSPAARAFVVQTGVPVTVGQPQWSQAVGDKVLWLAAQNVTAAEIRLDPPDLGPMQVKVSVNQDQATVSFTSPHPVVREALDQQLNRLREMFAEQGLNLVNVDVSDKSFAQQEREKNESDAGASTNIDDEDELQPVALTSAINMRLVDHYA